jgi:hypothetical protein
MVKHHQEKAVIDHQRVQTQQRNDALEARHLLAVVIYLLAHHLLTV